MHVLEGFMVNMTNCFLVISLFEVKLQIKVPNYYFDY